MGGGVLNATVGINDLGYGSWTIVSWPTFIVEMKLSKTASLPQSVARHRK